VLNALRHLRFGQETISVAHPARGERGSAQLAASKVWASNISCSNALQCSTPSKVWAEQYSGGKCFEERAQRLAASKVWAAERWDQATP